MPNYLGHTAINIGAGAVAAYALHFHDVLDVNSLVIAGTAFTFATLFLSPDLDLNYSNPAKNWGPLRILWWPYSLVFKHRGVSHSLLLSSFTRISYLALIICLLTYGFNSLRSWGSGVHWNEALAQSVTTTQDSVLNQLSWWHLYSTEILIMLAAIVLADLCHILADKTFSAAKTFIRA